MDKMQKPVVSECEGRFDRRAPLATFDTVDLGEDISFIQSSNSSTNEESVSESSDETNKIDSIRKRQFLKKHDSPKFEGSKSLAYEKLGEGSGNNRAEDSKLKNIEFPTHQQSPDDSFSDSSDSDNGYIQSGYISVTDGRVTKHDFPEKLPPSPFPSRYSRLTDHDISQESTPTSSPKLPKSPLPVLLNELENIKVESKRKALEKRIQRLQVTTQPVERPRSTTPINVVTFDEYKEISSPDKHQTPDHLEKLKIKLPVDEFNAKQKSPRKGRICVGSDSSNVFSFNEEHLFTHTKSAFLLQHDGSVGQTPKRILIPPCLSPALSPAASPVKSAVNISSPPVTASPKFYYNPTLKATSTSPPQNQNQVSSLVHENWIAFDDTSESQNSFANNQSTLESAKVNTKQACVPESTLSKSEKDLSFSSSRVIPDIVEHVVCHSEEEEILTINIEEFNNGTKVCNINVSDSVSSKSKVDENNSVSNLDNSRDVRTELLGDFSLEAFTDAEKTGVVPDTDECKQEAILSTDNRNNTNDLHAEAKTDTLLQSDIETEKMYSISNTNNQSKDLTSLDCVNGKYTHSVDLPEKSIPECTNIETKCSNNIDLIHPSKSADFDKTANPTESENMITDDKN